MPDWKPSSYNSVSPYLICTDAVANLAFIEHVFDGVLLRRFDRPDGSLMHAEIRIDDTVLMIGGGATGGAGSDTHLHVYVRDVAAVYARAIASGAQPVQEPARKSPDDDLRGGFKGPCCVTWWVASQ